MRLSDYLRECGETPSDFAARTGISQPYVSRLLKGERYPRPAMMARIAEATDSAVTANDFMPPRDDRAPATERAA